MEGYRPCPDCQALVDAAGLEQDGCPFCQGALGSEPVPEEVTAREARDRAIVLALALILMVPTAALGLYATLDLDGDGLSTWEEWFAGTSPSLADSDGDTLVDGWEVRHRLDPVSRDTDSDGVSDDEEVAIGSDPRDTDTDGDLLPDGVELQLDLDPTRSDSDGDRIKDSQEAIYGTDPTKADSDGDLLMDDVELIEGADPRDPDSDGDGILDGDEILDQDCDRDGAPALLDPDDDSDGRLDGDEDPAHRCNADVDDDGVLDGDEAHPDCIVQPDCDLDGVLDRMELDAAGFDPLDQDSFGLGLTDGVVLAFQEAGQPASGDDDGDGIPDAWESQSGLIDWGPYTPEANRTDLLVEFIKVTGPDSEPIASALDFTPAYDQVVEVFRDGRNITLQYEETAVVLDEETRPPFLPSSEEAYYEDLLKQGRFTGNPYVTTVVLNPQHDQSGTLHGGAAPIRGMLATVDYGVYSTARFGLDNGTLTLRPFYESLIAGGQTEAILDAGFTEGGVIDGGAHDGRYALRTETYTVIWDPLWFQGTPEVHWNDGTVNQTTFLSASVDEGDLAHVVLHELGHTLGLCHPEDLPCRENLTAADQQKWQETAMWSGGQVMAYLDSEWDQVGLYMQCPPQRPVVLVAEEAGRPAILDAKYRVTFEDILNVDTRACAESTRLDAQFEAATETAPFDSPRGPVEAHLVWHEETEYVPDWTEPQHGANDRSNSRAYWSAVGLGSLLVMSIPLLDAWNRHRRSRP